jgi:hypothetical protein
MSDYRKRIEIWDDMRLVVTNYMDKESGFPDEDEDKVCGIVISSGSHDKPVTWNDGATLIYIPEEEIPQLIAALKEFL